MDQKRVIEELYHWLKNQIFWPNLAKIDCDHVTEDKKSLGLYLGPKLQKKGRTLQIAQVDIIVHDDKNVRLIIEVDPNPNPKKILGVIFSALIADNYTPSKRTCEESFKLDNAVILYVTVIEHKDGSQKPAQIEEINKAIEKFIKAANLKVRLAKVCVSSSPEAAIENTKFIINELFNQPVGK